MRGEREIGREVGAVKGRVSGPGDGSSLRIVGAGFVTLRDRAGGSTTQMVYFAEGIGDFYLSKVACRALGVIGDDFPVTSAERR